jgi:hypothetical protein
MRIFLACFIAIAAVVVGPAATARADGIVDLINIGCQTVATPANSCVLTANVKGPGAPGELGQGSKEGQACGYNVLALFSWGDVRIATAMKNGGITKISSVDSKSFQLLPILYGFGRYCTVVSGE